MSEVVDRADHIALLPPLLDTMVRAGLVTLEDVRVDHYRAATPASGATSAPHSRIR